MRVSHHHMVVGHTLEVSRLGHHACPFANETILQLFWGVVTLDPQPHFPGQCSCGVHIQPWLVSVSSAR